MNWLRIAMLTLIALSVVCGLCIQVTSGDPYFW